MNQQIARCLFENCGFLLIAGVPEGAEFGIDLATYEIGEKFRGVKMIPEGVHFVYCSAKGTFGDVAPRVGFAHFFKAKEIVVREWDPEKEELRKRKPDQEVVDIQRIEENLKELDRYLAPYDFEDYAQWKSLTSHITAEIVDRVMPGCGLVRTAIEYLSCSDADRPRGQKCSRLRAVRSAADEDELLPDLKPIPGTFTNFTALPRLEKSSTPAQVSSMHLDSIELIEKFLQPDPDLVLGEAQFAFVLLLVGHSTDSLAHWARILGLVSNSEDAVTKFRAFYSTYLRMIQCQIPELPAELMEPTKNNTVYQDVRRLIGNCINGGLAQQVEQFKRVLYEKLNWRFDDLFIEDPDDLPVVVET